MSGYRIDYEKVRDQTLHMKMVVNKLQKRYSAIQELKETIGRNWEGPAAQQTLFQMNRLGEEMQYSIRQMAKLCSTVDQIALRMQKEDEHQALNVETDT